MAKNSMIPRTIIKQVLAASAVCVALCAPALAEGEMPDSEHGRYMFNKVAEGFLRLDTQTGQVSVCSQRAIGFACQAVPDDRTVLENEIARLRTENAALKNDDLIALKKAGFSDEVILSKIAAAPGAYRLDTQSMIDLKAAGLSDEVIAAMVKRGTK